MCAHGFATFCYFPSQSAYQLLTPRPARALGALCNTFAWSMLSRLRLRVSFRCLVAIAMTFLGVDTVFGGTLSTLSRLTR